MLVEPTWLEFTDGATAGCYTCDDVAGQAKTPQRFFVYRNVCFQQSPRRVVKGTISTTFGGQGSSDTSLMVFSELRNEKFLYDRGSRTCSDGSAPSPTLCPATPWGGKQCRVPGDQCASGSSFQSYTAIDIFVAAGRESKCYDVAIGVANTQLAASFIGLQLLSVV
jgi:hypothetical protein